MTLVERIAHWAATLQAKDIPGDVRELLAAQRRSVIGAMGASAENEAARRITRGCMSGRTELDEATKLYVGAVLSVALDFDDYMCFGHTGHSSVLASFLVNSESDAAEARLVAQTTANEVGARLGGACLLGPLNGQMWSFIHAAEGALAAGRELGLDPQRMAHALALALYQPPRPVAPGFLGADSKLMTVADPLVAGTRAARLAASGTTGPLDVLDHPQGFFSAFSYVPLRGFFESLGEGWAVHTLCVKPYPGCAYVDTVVDALMSLGPPPVEEVDRVDISAGLLTCGMEAMSSPYGSQGASPVTVNFSAPATAAVLLYAGEIGPDQLTESYLSRSRNELDELTARIKLKHDWDLTRRGTREFIRLVPPSVIRHEVPALKLARALGQLRRDHRALRVSWRDLRNLVRGARSNAGRRGPARLFDPRALEEFAMALPARVSVTFRDGRTAEAERVVPRGGAGHPTYSAGDAARDKFERFTPRLAGDELASKIGGAVDVPAADLPSLLDAAITTFVEDPG